MGLGASPFHPYYIREWSLFPCFFVYLWKGEKGESPLVKERWWCWISEAFLQRAGCLHLPETRRIKMSPFCEQMVRGDCVLRDSADARENMSFSNSISSSITPFIVSLILSHNCWFLCPFVQGDHMLFRVLVYLQLGKSLVPHRSFKSVSSANESLICWFPF